MEEIDYKLLEKIGLTGSETKVYLALLKLGLSKKGAIIKEAKIAPSKIYEVLDKLLEKGLVSINVKNNVKHFAAANPSRIKDYLMQKKEEISKDELLLNNLLPKLIRITGERKEARIETYIGWKGMETAYNEILMNINKGEEVYILGAGIGEKEQKWELFFTKYGRLAFKKRINIKVIFNENSREYVNKIEKSLGKSYQKRFLFENTPTEITICRDFVLIMIRKAEPIIIMVEDQETADSFIKYFNELWKIAEKN